jgi:hypothetical protein
MAAAAEKCIAKLCGGLPCNPRCARFINWIKQVDSAGAFLGHIVQAVSFAPQLVVDDRTRGRAASAGHGRTVHDTFRGFRMQT